jgi:hypothetical protein
MLVNVSAERQTNVLSDTDPVTNLRDALKITLAIVEFGT